MRDNINQLTFDFFNSKKVIELKNDSIIDQNSTSNFHNQPEGKVISINDFHSYNRIKHVEKILESFKS
jgi:hypothetical protein